MSLRFPRNGFPLLLLALIACERATTTVGAPTAVSSGPTNQHAITVQPATLRPEVLPGSCVPLATPFGTRLVVNVNAGSDVILRIAAVQVHGPAWRHRAAARHRDSGHVTDDRPDVLNPAVLAHTGSRRCAADDDGTDPDSGIDIDERSDGPGRNCPGAAVLPGVRLRRRQHRDAVNRVRYRGHDRGHAFVRAPRAGRLLKSARRPSSGRIIRCMNRRTFLQAVASTAVAASSPLRAQSARPRIDAARLRQELETLSAFGRPAGKTFADGVSRVAYSNADVAGRQYVIGLMREAGLEPRIDPAGNIFARPQGTATRRCRRFSSGRTSIRCRPAATSTAISASLAALGSMRVLDAANCARAIRSRWSSGRTKRAALRPRRSTAAASSPAT